MERSELGKGSPGHGEKKLGGPDSPGNDLGHLVRRHSGGVAVEPSRCLATESLLGERIFFIFFMDRVAADGLCSFWRIIELLEDHVVAGWPCGCWRTMWLLKDHVVAGGP